MAIMSARSLLKRRVRRHERNERLMLRATVLFGIAMVLLAGCGYFQAGTWEDDPDNWTRAFKSEKPPQVVVLHSRYWRSFHFTYEFEYFFAIQSDPAFKRELFSRNSLVQLPAEQVAEAIRDPFGEAPTWFCPKDAARYDAWIYKDPPQGNFRVLIDKDAGTIYMTDYQV